RDCHRRGLVCSELIGAERDERVFDRRFHSLGHRDFFQGAPILDLDGGVRRAITVWRIRQADFITTGLRQLRLETRARFPVLCVPFVAITVRDESLRRTALLPHSRELCLAVIDDNPRKLVYRTSASADANRTAVFEYLTVSEKPFTQSSIGHILHRFAGFDRHDRCRRDGLS